MKTYSRSENHPIIEVCGKNLKAKYYNDGSGEFELLHRGKEFLFEDDAKINDHIKYIEHSIKWWKTQSEIATKMLFTMNNIKEIIKQKKETDK